jgi:hypothetical protein
MTLRLTADELDFWVDVRLRSFAGRWIAVAELAGEQKLGLGLSAQEAIESAVSPLGPLAVAALLNDPQLGTFR